MPEPLYWTVAVLAAGFVSALAWKLRALSASGALAATVVGALIFGFGGYSGAAVLVLFFVSSSALSRIRGGTQRSVRGARQVLANGSLAAVAATLFGVLPGAEIAFLGAISAVTADTWATEIGVRFGGTPRSILTLQPREPGTSGAVSVAGTLGSGLGALTVALVGSFLLGLRDCAWPLVTAAGFTAAVIDSALGDSLQARYVCRRCGARPETARHAGCHVRAARVGGVAGLDNDTVNWITSLAGAALTLALRRLC